ncbi:MAG: protein translocase subunit SecD [Gammaproteobacteria bacterium]|nr:protein translocase subunit SecD [Gammaproteobacteria bacterium]MXX29642.1 protein translocase subunit SecD [Gammaproteobacteria bacterium]MYE50053.1 protein translocase subunit SecD [Gammaproteobacteria bacterium]MYH15687.1 protein translocase subunit SecD [Gammaproteobacteria bacterium]MYK82941.1 protein translocase subunit SecD [Gammaproteobacteria bacterium]
MVGERLLGLSPAKQRAPNTYPLGRYLFVLVVVTLGALYAAPNVFAPDPALQVKPEDPDRGLSAAALEQASTALAEAGITLKAAELEDGSGFLRLVNDGDQLRAREVVMQALAGGEDHHIVALTRASTTPQWLADLGATPMSLGLDLSGGVHLLLQVDMEKFVGDRMRSMEETARDALVAARIRYVGRNWVDGTELRIPFQSAALRDEAAELLTEQFEGFEISETDVDGRPALEFTMVDEYLRQLEDAAISQNLQSLRNRVNELGVSEPLVQRLGRERIVLDLPGIQDSAEAKRIINKFANLEFRLVALPGDRASQTETLDYRGTPTTLLRRNIVTGDQVTSASQDYDPETSLPQVSIGLDSDGGQRMNDATKDNVGRSMAIIFIEQKPRARTVMVDGEEVIERYTVEERRLISVATIQSALGYNFRITGLELGEARDLALLLRSGALAAPMYIVEERTVGASLGDENIKRGQQSVVVGFILVMIFMLIYYRGFGLAADLALIANLTLLVAVMSVLGATLTLPGIAGIVLTVGMAVDANVLIFSRIREELKQRAPQQAIAAGFDRALLTILDANITTFFVAIILFSIGSGPVKGFAVTLAVGIVTSVFTAIMGTRALVNLMYGGRNLKAVKI